MTILRIKDLTVSVLVPFYRGAVVFEWINPLIELVPVFSSPFIEERLYLSYDDVYLIEITRFSSPFIEERLYFMTKFEPSAHAKLVLVPFYRGAVVFEELRQTSRRHLSTFSSPFIEERLYLNKFSTCKVLNRFSSPFIEERLYLVEIIEEVEEVTIVLVPFYRGAVVFRRF